MQRSCLRGGSNSHMTGLGVGDAAISRMRGAKGLLSKYQGMTYFPLQSCRGVLPTLTLDTFGILQTPTTSQFWRCFRVLPIPSLFQQSPMLPHAPSIPTPRPTPPPIQSLVQCSSKTLRAVVEIEQLPQHLISRVKSLK